MNDHCDVKYQINVLDGVNLRQENRSCQRGAVADGRCVFHSDNPDKPLQPFIDEIHRQSSSSNSKDFDFCEFVFPKEAFTFPVAIRKPIFMEGCKFYGDASFQGLRFESYASFFSSQFFGEADFMYAGGDPYHRQASFGGQAIFNGVKFHKKVNFSACRFEALPEFKGTEFHDAAVFGWATIAPVNIRPEEDWLEFRHCVFSGQADFEVRPNEKVAGIRFAYCNLEGLLFSTLPRGKSRIEFENITGWCTRKRRYQWPRKKIRDEFNEPYDAIKVIDNYRFLEKYFYDHSDASLARHFYIGQMVALRRDPNYDKASRLMNRLYQLVSNYGASVLRPATAILLSLAIFPLFLLFSGINVHREQSAPQNMREDYDKVDRGQDTLQIRLTNYDIGSVWNKGWGGHFWEDYRSAVGANLSLSTFDRRHELSPPSDSISKGLLVVETVLNLVLASLVVVGVRRKFTPKKPLGE